jgi:hypothetical protein
MKILLLIKDCPEGTSEEKAQAWMNSHEGEEHRYKATAYVWSCDGMEV